MNLTIYVLALCYAVANAPEQNGCSMVGMPAALVMADHFLSAGMAYFRASAGDARVIVPEPPNRM